MRQRQRCQHRTTATIRTIVRCFHFARSQILFLISKTFSNQTIINEKKEIKKFVHKIINQSMQYTDQVSRKTTPRQMSLTSQHVIIVFVSLAHCQINFSKYFPSRLSSFYAHLYLNSHETIFCDPSPNIRLILSV